jgi:lipopolysaccharide transport system ATP-binding protein
MSDDIVIRAEGLGKKYVIGHEAQRQGYLALRDVVARNAHNAWRVLTDMARGRPIVAGDTTEEFWALKDVSFEVKRGTVLGVIGRNGAGKSTLLKIISRITEPSEGRVRVKGRVASLLEVGTGFHAELTGRENIYLNGAILGMSRAEIKRKFDEIVAFAEIDKFLDTQVKRYSSGMYVRLAFAIAAHLEPEILIVDEVLAVGDYEFQKRCMGKMSEVVSGGRTVLFVSHNLDATRRIGVDGLLLSSGHIELTGSIDQCIERYLSQASGTKRGHQFVLADKPKDRPHFLRIEILDDKALPLSHPKTWDYVKFRIFFHSPTAVRNGRIELYISTTSGTFLTRCSTSPDSAYSLGFRPGENFVDCDFPSLPLSAGSYVIGMALASPKEWLDDQHHVLTLEVESRDVFRSGRPPRADDYPLPMVHEWHGSNLEGLVQRGSGEPSLNPSRRSRLRMLVPPAAGQDES